MSAPCPSGEGGDRWDPVPHAVRSLVRAGEFLNGRGFYRASLAVIVLLAVWLMLAR